jgi:hypothetical protein
MRPPGYQFAFALIIPIAGSVRDACAQAPTRELSPAERQTVSAGGQVLIAQDMVGSSWPSACTYQFVEAAPEEVAAVFADYSRHKAFIPGLKKSTISRVIDRATTEVDYVLDIPIVADEAYTVRDSVSALSDGEEYRVDWRLVRATSTKATVGSVRFERYPAADGRRDGTLMTYCNFVTPGSRLAKLGFIKSRAMDQLRATATSIAREVERERSSAPALLAAQRRALRAATAP